MERLKAQGAGLWTAVGAALAVVLLLWGGLFWDQPALEAVREGFGNSWRGVAKILTRYGDFPWLFAAGLVALAVSLRWRRRDMARVVTAMLLAGILAGLVSNLTKLGTGRVRPHVQSVEHGWYGPRHEGQWVSLRHSFQSFPSSHAACAFGFFFPLFLSRRGIGALGMLVAAAIAWSRVQLNAHHISDVAAGAFVGMLAGYVVWRWIAERGGLARWLGDAKA